MAWYGIWHGWPFSLSGTDDLERFGSLADVAEVLKSRCESGAVWLQHFDYVSREPESVYTPAVTEESYIDLYRSADADLSCIERRAVFGPRGGVRFE
ncbi:hypothetical protein HDA32_005138 [Spinactinospora alkalitolerans]|uniref:Uncharacterized protein n=1 Tax=Spinactinospora alkalitolerans TaxID=687207 RepID=A0A852U1B8_9ACTN|nr:hypothetical protein [Spinactinospora alkalitolerans]NYE50018.1 hypothetical protein [Spinactinospora alkalitolerans]